MRYDAVIVGGSFAGLSAAIHIARGKRSVCVIDAGAPRNRFAKASHGFFGRDGANPIAMIAEARANVLAYPNVRYVAGTASSARSIESGGAFEVGLDSGETLSATKLVLAFGVSDVLPELAGLRERWGSTVLHCPYCHGYEFGDKRRGVLAVGPMSTHQATMIAEWGPTTFFTNGMNLDPEARATLTARKVSIEPALVAKLEGEAPELTGITLADGRTVSVAALYIASGVRMNSPIAAQLGCAFDEAPLGPIIRTDEMKLTTVPGVYAAGDIARAFTNATFASADGVLAGVSLHRSLIFDTPAAR